MNLRSEEDEYTKLFEEEYYNINSANSEDISLQRLNELFQNGSISAQEHSILTDKLFPYKRISIFALASLIISALNWILILKFTYHKNVYQLLSGEARYHTSLVLAPIALLLSLLAIREIKTSTDKSGIEIAVAGLTIAVVILTIMLPILFMELA